MNIFLFEAGHVESTVVELLIIINADSLWGSLSTENFDHFFQFFVELLCPLYRAKINSLGCFSLWHGKCTLVNAG